MSDASTPVPLARGTFRATITGVGRPGPIEERVGRRLVRVVDPESREGVALARSGRIRWVGPEGDCLGSMDLEDVRRLLCERFERRIAESSAEAALRDGLARLRAPARRRRA